MWTSWEKYILVLYNIVDDVATARVYFSYGTCYLQLFDGCNKSVLTTINMLAALYRKQVSDCSVHMTVDILANTNFPKKSF